MKGPGVERARVGFKETDGASGQRVHSTWTTSASPSIFAPLSIHSQWLCPAFFFCLSSTSTLTFPFIFPSFPSFSSPTPVRLLFGLCALPPLWSMGKRPRKGSSGYNESERRGRVRKWSVIALSAWRQARPLCSCWMCSTALYVCCHATVGTIKTTDTGHNIQNKTWLRANKCMAWEMHSLIAISAVLEMVLIVYHHWLLLLYLHIIKEYIIK